jgi:hypothetical protein
MQPSGLEAVVLLLLKRPDDGAWSRGALCSWAENERHAHHKIRRLIRKEIGAWFRERKIYCEWVITSGPVAHEKDPGHIPTTNRDR